ncbi:hypothetical protein M5K25_001002 [Dendrobium thyrsiflorum]|uniref:Uncharacterized protein n=1 Tax=Dendrobium thyrsiflorum TaxID=117978 RepID=A0ABD0WBV1_DENTH
MSEKEEENPDKLRRPPQHETSAAVFLTLRETRNGSRTQQQSVARGQQMQSPQAPAAHSAAAWQQLRGGGSIGRFTGGGRRGWRGNPIGRKWNVGEVGGPVGGVLWDSG